RGLGCRLFSRRVYPHEAEVSSARLALGRKRRTSSPPAHGAVASCPGARRRERTTDRRQRYSSASGTTSPTLGELSLVDCPAGGYLGFAFTMAPSFDGNQTSAQMGAPQAQRFNQASWMDDALVARKNADMSLADPLCSALRQQMPSDYC